MADGTNPRDELLAALQHDTAWQPALESLLALGAEKRRSLIDATVAGALVMLLGDPSRTRQRRAADVICGLVGDVPGLTGALRSALSAPDPRLRWGAAYTMGHAVRPPAESLWPAVRETLALEDGDQRWAAAELACDLAREHPAVRAEILTAVAAGSATVRRMLLYCLRDLSDPELLEVAKTRLRDEDPGVRLAALSAAARAERTATETEALCERIAPLLERDPDAGVRRAAAATLGKLGATTPTVVLALERAAAGPDASLARAAKAARERLAP